MKLFSYLNSLFISLIYVVSSYAQITVNQPIGLSQGINGEYTLVVNTLPSVFTVDANTQIYRKTNSVGGGVIVYQFIFRQNNIWKQGISSTGPGVPANNESINIETVEPCLEISPPCSTFWKTANGTQYRVNMSGSTCNTICSPIVAPEITPQYLKIPIVVTETISQIANPKIGMMVYDATSQTLKVYSNGVWRSLAFQ